MLRKIAVLMSVMCFVAISFAQNGQGTIKGKMTDKATGEPLAFANVVAIKGGSQVGGAQTDFDGKYTITALTPGKYEIQASYVGYQPIKQTGVLVYSGKITFVNLKAGQGVDLKTFVVTEYKEPLISKDQTSSGGTVTRESIARMPGRSAASIAQTVGGVYSKDDGSTALNIRGSRSSGTDVYIDGIKVRGSQNLPSAAIEQVSVMTGGIPAQYGDATGGIVNITTRGASKEWFGGIEYLTSGFKKGSDQIIGLDNHGFNLLGFSLSGPLLTKKDSAGNKKDAILGFFLSGELKNEVDPRPSAATNYKVNDDLMSKLNANPLLSGTDQATGVINSASYVKSSDLVKIPFRLNTTRKGLNLAGKIDITTSSTTNVTIGGSFDYTDQNLYIRKNALFNSQNNPQRIDRTWRTYARFTQRFENATDQESASLIKNAFISFQVDYSNVNSTTQDETHKDQFSRYGYLGKFTTTRINTFESIIDTVFEVDANGNLTGVTHAGYLSNPSSILYTYQPGDVNPVLANYTSSYYDIYAGNPVGFYQRPEDVQGNGGLLNGDSPADVYDIWTAQGVQYNQYATSNQTQFRVSASGSADIKGHAIKIGFEYEQRNDRSYSINPSGLWTLGRQLVNTQIAQRSFEQGTYTIFTGQGGNSVDNILLTQAYDPTVQEQFDKNLRKSLGMAEDGTNWIDFDSYGPDVWNIGMFTADEIYKGARGTLSNYGYDFTGKKLSGNPSLDDFFNKVDANGNKTRDNQAFQPIYVAGYIQDKFSFDDLIFNLGVRVDRYDANQAVLKDKYSLFPVKTVGEVGGTHPSNIGDNYVVYVENSTDPKLDKITGYRNGDTWYNAAGQEIKDPSVLSSTRIPNPWLVNPNDGDVYTDLSAKSFKDFQPQVNVSPRISFSFPISDEALFFAHYDILTQRPSSNNRLDMLSYLNFNQGGNNMFNVAFNNPALKSEKTIDYELGFQQKLSNSSALKLSAFYKEMRDQIQVKQVIGAYPGNYITYDNEDFGTVKGLTVSYDLRRTGNVTLRAAYTLQFADGTGSSVTTSQNLVASGNGNLRTLIPLSFDQRHFIVLSGDYRYTSGKSYNGPVIFGKKILENTGANLTLRSGSGSPYTKTSRVVGTQLRSFPNSPQEGQLNASRLPWTSTVDLKVDKTFDLKWGKGEDENKSQASLNVYVQVLNLLDAQNILNVYSATGNANDDGYLAAAEWQNQIALAIDEAAYRDLYTTKLASNQFNYALPRRIRLGIQLNF